MDLVAAPAAGCGTCAARSRLPEVGGGSKKKLSEVRMYPTLQIFSILQFSSNCFYICFYISLYNCFYALPLFLFLRLFLQMFLLLFCIHV